LVFAAVTGALLMDGDDGDAARQSVRFEIDEIL